MKTNPPGGAGPRRPLPPHPEPSALSPWYRQTVATVSKGDEQNLQAALAAELRSVQGIANITVRTWVADIPVSADSVHRILRGSRPVTVVELLLLSGAINEDPQGVIARAATRAKGSDSRT